MLIDGNLVITVEDYKFIFGTLFFLIGTSLSAIARKLTVLIIN